MRSVGIFLWRIEDIFDIQSIMTCHSPFERSLTLNMSNGVGTKSIYTWVNYLPRVNIDNMSLVVDKC